MKLTDQWRRIKQLPNERWFVLGFWYSFLTSFGTAHGLLFGTYHLDMFVSVWQLSASQIASVHVIYMIWNVANDLISGYISDWYQHRYGHRGSRLSLVQPMTIMWCFVSLLPFYPIPFLPNTLHYFLTISLFDGFFSFVCITTGAIWTDDLTSTQSDRVRLQLIHKPMNAVMVSVLSWISYHFWNKQHLASFRMVLWITIMISIVSTQISCHKLREYLQCESNDGNESMLLNESGPLKAVKSDVPNNKQNPTSLVTSTKEGLFSLGVFIKSVSSQSNLWMFIGASVINETQSVFLSQFTSIFVDVLLSEWTSSQRAYYLSFSSFVNFWIGIGTLYLVQQHYCTLYSLSTWAVSIKIGMGFLAFSVNMLWSRASPGFCAFYILMFKIANGIFVSFFAINIANLCDEQKAYRLRKGLPPLSSMVSMYWGLHALCAKPFNSLGPVVGITVLERYGYSHHGVPGESIPFAEYDKAFQLSIKGGCYALMLWFLWILSVLQYLFWSKYSLYGKQLADKQRIIKQASVRERI